MSGDSCKVNVTLSGYPISQSDLFRYRNLSITSLDIRSTNFLQVQQRWNKNLLLRPTRSYPKLPHYPRCRRSPLVSIIFLITDIADAPIGPRSTLYTEPSFLSACQYEFQADTESFISIAEKLVIPYEWSTYDVLVLPKSFPYGGMENPNLTTVTPTLIAGDRSNVDVVAHEASHSWSGNLVTNATWQDFWLNEGLSLTVY